MNLYESHMQKSQVAVLVSGGVDSAVSLALLKKQNIPVVAFYLKIWLEDELEHLGHCPWQEDLEIIEKLCHQLDVELRVVSMQKEYWQEIVSYTLEEVHAGRTPNPDMLCNPRIKFGAFFEKIKQESFSKIATGHYARHQRVKTAQGLQDWLLKSPDPVKDQTYFLARLSHKQLASSLFPIGDYTKQQIRQLAHRYKLAPANRPDSQGLCFLGKIKFRDFISHYIPPQKGDIIEIKSGTILGNHSGAWLYTIGQRQGLGLGGGPWYVVDKDLAKNLVYVSNNYDNHQEVRMAFEVTNLQWLPEKPKFPQTKLTVKVRHGPEEKKCQIEEIEDDRLLVNLQKPDQGLASGQFAVFYDKKRCRGSGIIETTSNFFNMMSLPNV